MAKRRKDERRTPGTGYTTQAANGTHTGYYPRLGGGYHVKRGFDTRAAAEAWLDSLVAQRAQKMDVGSGQQKLSVWIDRWAERESKAREWKVKMVADVAWKLGYVKPHLGDKALADVMPDDVDVMLDELARDLAQNTVRQIRNYLFQVFESARERRYITFNPVIKPARRKRAKQKPPVRLTTAQAAALLRAAEPSFYALAWWLLLTLGLRAGEICGLRWGDVDYDAGVIHILQEVTDVRGTATKDAPKNDKQRHLPIPRALIPALKLHQRAYTLRAAHGTKRETWHEHGLVFPGRSGKPMNPTSLRHQLTTLTAACKLPNVTTHMLRHTAAKFYTDAGCPQPMTAALLGHAPNITGHYAPPDADAMRPYVEQVYGMLAGASERGRKTG